MRPTAAHGRDRARPVTTLAVLALALVAGGCSSDQPLLIPAPHYRPAPVNPCTRMPVDQIAARFDLTTSHRYERTPRRSLYEDASRIHCGFYAYDEAGRFKTVFGRFTPSGSVGVHLQRDSATARLRYRDTTGGIARRQHGIGNVYTITPIIGWWDAGIRMWATRAHPPGSYPPQKVNATVITVAYWLQHRNLYLSAYLRAVAPAGDTATAIGIMDRLLRTLIDHTTDHLHLTTNNDWPTPPPSPRPAPPNRTPANPPANASRPGPGPPPGHRTLAGTAPAATPTAGPRRRGRRRR